MEATHEIYSSVQKRYETPKSPSFEDPRQSLDAADQNLMERKREQNHNLVFRSFLKNFKISVTGIVSNNKDWHGKRVSSHQETWNSKDGLNFNGNYNWNETGFKMKSKRNIALWSLICLFCGKELYLKKKPGERGKWILRITTFLFSLL